MLAEITERNTCTQKSYRLISTEVGNTLASILAAEPARFSEKEVVFGNWK